MEIYLERPSNLPVPHSPISWLNDERFVFLSLLKFPTVTLKCGISGKEQAG